MRSGQGCVLWGYIPQDHQPLNFSFFPAFALIFRNHTVNFNCSPLLPPRSTCTSALPHDLPSYASVDGKISRILNKVLSISHPTRNPIFQSLTASSDLLLSVRESSADQSTVGLLPFIYSPHLSLVSSGICVAHYRVLFDFRLHLFRPRRFDRDFTHVSSSISH